MTATPAQRVVMLFDRLGLDLNLAEAAVSDPAAEDVEAYGTHLSHAMQIIAELQSSLDQSAGGPAANLASLYSFVLVELVAARGGDRRRIAGIRDIMDGLRAAFAQVADDASAATAQATATAGSWVS
jgi:flagellar protein FliS